MNSLRRSTRSIRRLFRGISVQQRTKFTLPPPAYTTDLQDLFTVETREKTPHVFTDAEFNNRLTKLRSYMQKENIDVSVFTSIHNINYFSGFMYCAFGRPYGLLVSQDDTCVISALIDAEQPWRRSRAEHSVVYSDWKKDNYYKAISHLISDMTGTVGCELDHISVENMNKLKLAVGNRHTVDISHATMKMRTIKSAEEHKLISEGARICDIGAHAAVARVKEGGEGTPEHEVALAAEAAMVREIADTYPMTDIMDIWVWFQSGINTDGAHNPVTTRKLRKGDILNHNSFPMIQGYYTAVERTMFYDHCDESSLRYWEINCEVYKRGIELMKPGVRCMDIALELNEIYKKYDLLKYRMFGYGHSFGTLCHYYGREAGVELREDIETVIEPGMVVSMEPMITIPQGMPGAGGYREHDIFIITESGAKNISGFPVGPNHNIIKS